MKKTLKFLYIIFVSIICFCMFSKIVKATVTCEANRKNDYEASFHIYDTSDTEHMGGSFVSLKLDSSTNKILTLDVCGTSIIKNGSNVSKYDLSTKRSFNCDIDGSSSYTVSFGSINFKDKFYKLTNNITCGIAYPSTVNITGLKNAPESSTSDAIMCSGANYNFIVRKGQDNQTSCSVTIQQDSANGDVIMKHGGLTTTNPRAGKYKCETPEGDIIEFSLSKNLNKGGLKSNDDCPNLTAVSGTDGSQADIEDPIVKPSDDIIDYPESSTHASDPDDNLKRKGHITVNNIFEVVTNRITCSGALSNTLPILRDIFKYIRLAAALLFLALTSFDYVKAIADSDSSLFKKANQRIVKRAIILVVIIILPSIINLVLAIVQLSNGACEIN